LAGGSANSAAAARHLIDAGPGFVLPDDVEKFREFTHRFNKAVGSAIVALCNDRDLKQEDAAKLLRISTRQMRRMERGQAAYTVVQLELIARATQTTMIEIIKMINSIPPGKPGKRKKG
jgi:hypothetical protein